MDFSEKLNYLFELSHAEGQELAAFMNVTPPQISKMRRGVRGLPKNRDAAYTLTRFFAQRCNSGFQLEALSKVMRIAQVKDLEGENVLASVILDWLADDQDPDDYAAERAGDFLRQFGSLMDSAENGSHDPNKLTTMERSSFLAYYGNEGKRLAVQAFLGYLLSRREAHTINILSDESLSWILEGPGYSKSLYASMVRLTEIGCSFRRICGPLISMDEAFESLDRWMPLYMTGKAKAYYYRRLRDQLNRITLFVVPDIAVLFSFSVGGMAEQNAVTFFTADTKTVNAMAVQYENYFSLCEPIMNVYSPGDPSKQLYAIMLAYEEYGGACIQCSNSLSFITLPWEIATLMHSEERPEEKNDFLTSLAQRYKKFKSNLEHYEFVDIIRLTDMDTVMRGEAVIPAAAVLGDRPQFYSPAGYLLHLRSIVYLLEHNTHYHVVLRKPEDTIRTIIYVKEAKCAILMRNIIPFTVFEVSENHLVDAFAEFLHRLVPNEQNELLEKRAVIATLRAEITAIETRIREAETNDAVPKKAE